MSDDEFKAFVYHTFNRIGMRLLFIEAMLITLIGAKAINFLGLF